MNFQGESQAQICKQEIDRALQISVDVFNWLRHSGLARTDEPVAGGCPGRLPERPI